MTMTILRPTPARRAVVPGARGLISVRADAKTPAELVDELRRTHSQFMEENDKRIKALESKGTVDTVLTEKVDRINADITRISADWQKAVAELEKKLNRPGLIGLGGDQDAQARQVKLFNASLRAHSVLRGRGRPAPVDAEGLATYSAGLDQFLRAGRDGIDVKAATVMQVGSDPDGGYLVTPQMDQTIDKLMRQLGAMRSVAQQITIGTGSFKKRVQTSGAAAGGWGNERTAPTVTDGPRLAELEFVPGTLWAEPEVTTELLEDASIDIEQYLAEEVGITFGEQEEQAFATGNGINRPKGMLSYDTVLDANWVWGKVGYVKTTNAADFAAANPSDTLISVQHALKRQYRPNASWMMNDATLAKIRKFKDGQGQYLWVPGLDKGIIGVLLGSPVVSNDFMSDVGANAYPLAYGDFRRAYLIVDRRGTVALRDPYTAKPYVLFFTTRRVGGGIQNFQAVKFMKCEA